jgi:hypothetical protein
MEAKISCVLSASNPNAFNSAVNYAKYCEVEPLAPTDNFCNSDFNKDISFFASSEISDSYFLRFSNSDVVSLFKIFSVS